MFVGCPIFVRQGRAQKHTPHKTARRGDLIYLWVGVFIPAGYIWGVFFCVPTLPAGDISIVIAIKFFLESILFLS